MLHFYLPGGITQIVADHVSDTPWKFKDRMGMLHPVVADVGCRNTVFHGKAQSGAAYYNDFCSAGIRLFRIELLREDASETSRILATYDALIKGQLSGEALIRKSGRWID